MPQPRQPPMDYQPHAGPVTVRGMRLLLALTIVNTILLGAYVLGPGLSNYLQAQWSSWQQRRAAKQAAAAQLPQRLAMMKTQEPALAYTLRPKTLVYEDVVVPEGWNVAQPPGTVRAVHVAPAEFTALPRALKNWGLLQQPQYTPIFMHERRAVSNSPPRLLIVLLDADPPQYQGTRQVHDAALRGFVALTIQPASRDADLQALAWTSYHFRADKPRVLRVYGGQIDPGDSARFTIACDMDGNAGMIKGVLGADDQVVLEPDALLEKGWNWSGGSGQRR
jgi:hypothetical protein